MTMTLLTLGDIKKDTKDMGCLPGMDMKGRAFA